MKQNKTKIIIISFGIGIVLTMVGISIIPMASNFSLLNFNQNDQSLQNKGVFSGVIDKVYDERTQIAKKIANKTWNP